RKSEQHVRATGTLVWIVEIAVRNRPAHRPSALVEAVRPERAVQRYLRKRVIPTRVEKDPVQQGHALRDVTRAAREALRVIADGLVLTGKRSPHRRASISRPVQSSSPSSSHSTHTHSPSRAASALRVAGTIVTPQRGQIGGRSSSSTAP